MAAVSPGVFLQTVCIFHINKILLGLKMGSWVQVGSNWVH